MTEAALTFLCQLADDETPLHIGATEATRENEGVGRELYLLGLVGRYADYGDWSRAVWGITRAGVAFVEGKRKVAA